MTKSELRSIYLEKRKALPPEVHAEGSRRIAENFFQKADLDKVRYLHCYLPIERLAEVDTNFIFRKVWSDFPEIRTVVPRVDHETGEIENLTYSESDDLAANVWQIWEPTHSEKIEPRNIDLVVVPLICFDRSGHRIGYGKGFYDRFLTRCRPDCLKIGLSFFPPVDKIGDPHANDIRLNFCVTPDHVYSMEGSNGEPGRG